jgi:thioredoxin 1
MLSRRSLLVAVTAASAILVSPALATETKTYTPEAFAAAQKAGKPILIAIHASWCPTCAVQRPILSELMADPKFNNLVYFVADFDSQKDAVRFFGARMQSTLIAFKGERETGRSVGDTKRLSIAALLNKTL